MSEQHLDFNKELILPIVLDIHTINLTDQQFVKLCRDNSQLRIELSAQGKLIIMPPTGSKTGWRNAKLLTRLTIWTEKDGSGLTFDSSTGFTLPNGTKRSPNVSWLTNDKWQALTEIQ